VERGDLDFGVDDPDAAGLGNEVVPPERARRVYALEAVEDLEPVAGREHEDRRELPMKRERPSHRLDRRRLADAERTETLAEVGEGHAHGGDGCSVIHVR
jgi:hypothetical protein